MGNEKNFLDFTDFIELIKESVPDYCTYEDIFGELLYILYEKSDMNINSTKDDHYDIRKKKKAFNPSVRKAVTLQIFHEIEKSLSKPLLEWIFHPHLFIDKLLYLVKTDEVFFDNKDVTILEENQENYAYVMTYVLIRTVITSDRSKKMKHPADYNAFRNYKFSQKLSSQSSGTSVCHNALVTTSKNIYNNLTQSRNSMPSFNSSLLSNGISYDTYRSSFNLKDSFTITTDGEDERPLSDFLETSENLLITGEGGIGKTTFLYSCLKKYHEDKIYDSVPIYIKLSDCSTNTDHQHIILSSIHTKVTFSVNGNEYHNIKDIIDAFSQTPSTNDIPDYTLLLDGFNEITAMDNGEIRTSIANEIQKLLNFPNIRIILTSREIDLSGMPLNKFKTIKANGIKTEDIQKYLQTRYSPDSVTEIMNNTALIEYLKIPLFLLMYSYSESTNHTRVYNRGAILYNFFNGRNSFYNEKSNLDEKNDKKTFLLMNVLLDFILPNIGYFMIINDTLYITEEQLEYHIEQGINCGRRFIPLNADSYKHYKQGFNNLRYVLNLFTELYMDDVIILLKDCLGIITTDSTSRLYFSHQYIRDYFAAMYCVREMYYLNISQNTNTSSDFNFGEHIWGTVLTELVAEILSIPSEFQLGELTYKTIKLFRNPSMHYEKNDFALTNLIPVLALENNGNLYKYDLSNLNLSNCYLSDLNFSSFDHTQLSRFDNSHIGAGTFSSSRHEAPVLQWAISEDEKTIISISIDSEIKIWNLTTQKCLYTCKLDINLEVSNIYSLELYENSTLLVISYGDSFGAITAIATYDILTEQYTCYHCCTDVSDYIIYFGYDIYTKTLLSVFTNGSVIRYTINNKVPAEKITYIHPDFLNRMTTDYLPNDLKSAYELKKIYLMANNKLLYVESDVLYPYFHGIDDNIYYGSDSYDASIVNEPIDITKIKLRNSGASYHINYFIYDLDTMETHDLQLDCTLNEITSLVLCGTIECNSLAKHTAISKDKKRIAIHNMEHIFIYDLSDNKYCFKTVCKLPYSSDFQLKFCHKDTNILTLYSNQLIHLNITTGSQMYSTYATGTHLEHKVIPSANHIINEISIYYPLGGNLDITNIYNQISNTLILSHTEEIIAIYSDQDYVYVLFDNCTIIYLEEKSLQVKNCYNFAPGRKIIAHTYDTDAKKLCFVSSPAFKNIDGEVNIVTSVDLYTGNTLSSAGIFPDVNAIHYTQHANNLLLFCEEQIHLLDAKTLRILDTQESLYGLYDPEYIWNTGDTIHITFTYDLIMQYQKYYGFEITYVITKDQKLKIDKVMYLPSFVVDDNTPELMYRYIPNTGMAFVKSITPYDDITIATRYLKYSTDDEYYYRMLYDYDIKEQPLSEWNLVFLHTKDGIIKTPRKNDLEIVHSFNLYSDMLLGCRNNHYCLYSSSGNFKPIAEKNILANCKHVTPHNMVHSIIYYQPTDSSKIIAYDLLKQKIIHQSAELQPNFLAYKCDFSNCTGDLSKIPTYI